MLVLFQKREAPVNQEISKDITKAFKESLRTSNKEDELIELFGKVTGKKLPPKRVAASQLDEKRERLVRRRKQWAAVMNLASHAKSLYDAYILHGDGEIGEPRNIVEDKNLSLVSGFRLSINHHSCILGLL